MKVFGEWMRADPTQEQKNSAFRAIESALESGYTLFDHADIYSAGRCEAIFGEFLEAHPDVRDHIVIASKCGIIFAGHPTPESPHRWDFSHDHIIWSCEQSLKRLRTDRIDLYQLHRPDLLMNPPEIARAFDRLKQAGKVREFGVSNFSPSFVRALQAHLPMRLAVNQVEISLAKLDALHDGTLDQCIEMNITPLAWGPVAGGVFADGGTVKEEHPRRQSILETQQLLDAIAKRLNVARTVIALAWLLKHPSGIVPLVGSGNAAHIATAARADAIEIDREDWYRLYVAARGSKLP